MSEDEQQVELTRMLLLQHSLKKTQACLENKRERMEQQLQAALNHLKDIGGTTMTEVPTADEIRSILNSLSETREELKRLERRLGAC